jgi:hypothetical protein
LNVGDRRIADLRQPSDAKGINPRGGMRLVRNSTNSQQNQIAEKMER